MRFILCRYLLCVLLVITLFPVKLFATAPPPDTTDTNRLAIYAARLYVNKQVSLYPDRKIGGGIWNWEFGIWSWEFGVWNWEFRIIINFKDSKF